MKKIKYIEFLPIIIISFLAFRLLNEKLLMTSVFSYILSMCSPFFWALAIGYIVNIAMNAFEKKLHFSRTWALSSAYLLILVIMILLIVGVIPQLISTVPDLISDSSGYAKNFNSWYETNVANQLNDLSSHLGEDVNQMITSKMKEFLQFMTSLLQNILSGLGGVAYSLTTGLIDFFIGFVISIYILHEKEVFFFKTRKLSSAFLGEKFTKKASEILNDTDIIFGNYLVAKSLDSFIVAVIAVIGFKILGIQYAFLFGIIIGVTNMIPYFGPMIGAVPVLLITVFRSPMQALWAAIFILVLQQVDGNIIGPKIVDEKVGLPALWGVVSVTVGGYLFGFLGMLLGTPVFAVFRKIVLDIQDKKLDQKGLTKNFIEE